MKKLKVTIKEKEKKISSFNLYNFRDEVVNFMYKKTVAESSRNSMVFYVLFFFLSLKNGEKTLLEDLLEKNIKKVESLNIRLSSVSKLERGQYADFVEQEGLKDVFQFDIFFLVIIAFKNYKEIRHEFSEFFDKSPEIATEYEKLNRLYSKRLLNFFESFETNLIQDDRTGYTGQTLDLSKSVYRTIKMRSSRRIDLTLHKHAEVKSISSQSPIIVEVIQHIDPEIVFQIWEAYSLQDYVKDVWQITEEKIFQNKFVLVIGGGVAVNAVYDSLKWLTWKVINGNKNRKGKDIARKEFKRSLEEGRKNMESDPIQNALTRSVISSNEYLQNEVKQLKKEREELLERSIIAVDQKDRIKSLEDRLEKLENVEVEVEDLDE